MYAVNPLVIILTNVVIIQIIFTSIPGLNKPIDGGQSIFDIILGTAFPILVLVGYITSCGIYAIGPALDRWDKTRYLLNFAGQRSTSYYLGMFLADLLIFEISVVCIILLTVILNITIITQDGNWFYMGLCMSVFGLPFIALSYAIGYIIKDPETGYKFAIIFGMTTYGLPLIITIWVPSLSDVFEVIIPWISLNTSLHSIVAPSSDQLSQSVIERVWLNLFAEIC